MILASVAYLLVVVLQLFSITHEKKTLEHITKPLLMPFLFLILFLSHRPVSRFVLLGLVGGFLGDVFLMQQKSNVALIGGILAFGLGHIFYTIALAKPLPQLSLYIVLFLLVFYLVVGISQYQGLKSMVPQNLRLPIVIYIVIILAMSYMASLLLVHRFSWGSIFTWVGAILFVLSDLKLAYQLFERKTKEGYFVVMLLYIVAQTSLIAGFLIGV